MSQQLAGLAALRGPGDAPTEEKAEGKAADESPEDDADVPPEKKPSVEEAFGDLSDDE